MNRTTSALLHGGFVLTGVANTLLGPLLPWLTSRWHVTDAQAGFLFTAQFAGSMAGVALSGIAVRRLGFRSALVLGYALLAFGIGTMSALPWPVVLAPVFIYGIGLGITIPATNLCVSDTNPSRRAAALNLLNLAWGLGAVLCPALISVCQKLFGQPYFLPLLSMVLTGLTLTIAFADKATREHGLEPRRTAQSGQEVTFHFATTTSAAVKDSLPLGAIFILAPLFYLYVGAESSLSGWIAAYASRLSAEAGSAWLLAPSFFWAALLSGRAIAPIVLERLSDLKLSIVSLSIAALGITTLVSAGRLSVVLVGVAIAGLGLAAVYPITIAVMSHWLGGATSRVAPCMFALAAMGGATLPWAVGHLSTRTGTLRSGLFVPLACTLIMLLLYSVAMRRIASAPVAYEAQHHATHA